MVVTRGGTLGKKIANPINENENHTIWLLKEVHHEKPNQSLSENIVIQVVLYTIIVPGLMNKEPPRLQPAYGPGDHARTTLYRGKEAMASCAGTVASVVILNEIVQTKDLSRNCSRGVLFVS